MTFSRQDLGIATEETGPYTRKILEDLQAQIDTFAVDASSSIAIDVQSDYGAVGDGTTDDTEALQKAFNAIKEAGGGEVYFPPGDYVISDTLDIEGSISLISHSMAKPSATGIWQQVRIDARNVPTNKTVLNIHSDVDDGFRKIVQLDRIHVLGSQTIGSGNLIDIGGVAVAYFRECLFKDAPNHLLHITRDVERMYMYGCYLQKRGDSQRHGDGIHATKDASGEAVLNMPVLVDTDVSLCEHALFWDNEGASHTVLPGIFDRCGFTGAGKESAYIASKGDIHMSQCWFENGGTDGVTPAPAARFRGGRLYRIENCYFAGNGSTAFQAGDPVACHIDGALLNNIIGCYFNTPGIDPHVYAPALKISGAAYTMFLGNTVANGDGRALTLEESTYSEAWETTLSHLTMSGNYFGGYHGIRVEPATNDHVIISNNSFQNWGGYISGIENLDSTTVMVGNTIDPGTGAPADTSKPHLQLGEFYFNGLYPANNSTPSVGRGSHFRTVNTSNTTITNFDEGTPGHPIWILINDEFTSIDFTQTHLHGFDGNVWKGTPGDLVYAVLDNTGHWHCHVPQTQRHLYDSYEIFAEGDTTPSVASGERLYGTNNSTLTTITQFEGGHDGQWFILQVNDNNTSLAVDGNPHFRCAWGNEDLQSYNSGGIRNWISQGAAILCVRDAGNSWYLWPLDHDRVRGTVRISGDDTKDDTLGAKLFPGINSSISYDYDGDGIGTMTLNNLIEVRSGDPSSPEDGQMWIVN